MLPRKQLLGCIVYFRRCPYKVLLQHHCPVSWKQRGDKSSLRRKHVAKATVARLLTDHIHPRQVTLIRVWMGVPKIAYH